MKIKSFFIVSLILASVPYLDIDGFSLSSVLNTTKAKLRSIFAPSNHTQVMQKDIKRTTQKTIVLENKLGNIKVKTDWNQDIISIKAVKTAKEEDLNKIFIAIETKNADTITLKTVYTKPDITGSVDYTLMIPKGMTLRLKTEHGTIRVKRFDGHVWATTDSGTLEIAQVTGSVTAIANEWGSIAISQSKGSINASTHNGNVEIKNAQNNVVASTDKGMIICNVQEVPATSSITLQAAGALTVLLPEDTNAHVRAQALSGKVCSEHDITLASKTTKLNPETWKELQRNVEGTLGTGEAEISLASQNGSIKILASDVA